MLQKFFKLCVWMKFYNCFTTFLQLSPMMLVWWQLFVSFLLTFWQKRILEVNKTRYMFVSVDMLTKTKTLNQKKTDKCLFLLIFWQKRSFEVNKTDICLFFCFKVLVFVRISTETNIYLVLLTSRILFCRNVNKKDIKSYHT